MTEDGSGRSPASSDIVVGSSSWTTSMRAFFDDNVDEQRMERLRACKILQDVLAECRRSRRTKEPTTNNPLQRTHLEDVPAGIRMVRYFQWRDVHDFDRKCSREAHSVWACRAGALQCGSELVQLRSCFIDLQDQQQQQQQQEQQQQTTTSATTTENSVSNPYRGVLGSSATAYEPKRERLQATTTNRIPCREFQEQVGRCVGKNAALLAQREAIRAERAVTAKVVPGSTPNESV